MNLGMIKKVYAYVLVAIVMALTLTLVGCSSNSDSSTSDSSNETTSSKSADDEWTQVDTSWAYKVDGTKTIFKRSDGYEFTVKAECGSVYTPTPEKEQAKSSFGTKGDVSMSFDICNSDDVIQSTYKSFSTPSSNGVIEGSGGVKAYFSKLSNRVSICKESENLLVEVIYGSEIIEEDAKAKEALDYFEFK